MGNVPKDPKEFSELSERKKLILKSIVEAHIAEGEPVGSKYLIENNSSPAPPQPSATKWRNWRQWGIWNSRIPPPDVCRAREATGFTLIPSLSVMP